MSDTGTDPVESVASAITGALASGFALVRDAEAEAIAAWLYEQGANTYAARIRAREHRNAQG